jgi:hypothetical protein
LYNWFGLWTKEIPILLLEQVGGERERKKETNKQMSGGMNKRRVDQRKKERKRSMQ